MKKQKQYQQSSLINAFVTSSFNYVFLTILLLLWSLTFTFILIICKCTFTFMCKIQGPLLFAIRTAPCCCYSTLLPVYEEPGFLTGIFTTNLTPQCQTFSRALKTERLNAPQFPGPGGTVDTNDMTVALCVNVQSYVTSACLMFESRYFCLQ